MLIVTEAFVELAEATLQSRGMPELPMVVLPHDTEVLPMEELRPVVVRAVEQEILPMINAARVV